MDMFDEFEWRQEEPEELDEFGSEDDEPELVFLSEEDMEENLVFQRNNPWKVCDKGNNKPKKAPKKPKLKNLLQQYNKRSRLTIVQHNQCLKALELLETDVPVLYTREQKLLIEIYNSLKSAIDEEHKEFLEFAEENWNKKIHLRIANFNKTLHKFALTKRAQKFETIKNYPTFYVNSKMIPLSNNQNYFELIHEGVLLELGNVGLFMMPDIKTNNSMYVNKLPPMKFKDPDEIVEMAKLSVSQDTHAEYLAKQSGCNIVISSSSLKTIIDNFGPDFKGNWDIPIIVKQCVVNEEKFNIVFIDKTLPQKNITLKDLEFYVRKILLKRCMCSTIDHSLPTPQCIVTNFNEHKTIENSDINTEIKSHVETNACSSKTTPKKQNNINIESPMNEASERITRSKCKSPMETNACSSKTTPKKQKNIESPAQESSPKMVTRSATKQLKNVKNELKKNETDEESEIKDYQRPTRKIPNIRMMNHNVNYRLWKLKIQEENILMKNIVEKSEVKFLVRSKIDACSLRNNGEKLNINLVPKLEYQFEHGGEILTKSELLRQWTTLCFRPFSNLVRVRIFPINNQYLKFESINLNKMTNECKKQNINPKDSLGVLFNVLSNLTDLEPGEYILRHTPKHGPFVALMKSVLENTPNSLNLHESYSEENCSIAQTSAWVPIDKTLILQHHIKNELLPGIFPPKNFGRKRKVRNRNKKLVIYEGTSDY